MESQKQIREILMFTIRASKTVLLATLPVKLLHLSGITNEH